MVAVVAMVAVVVVAVVVKPQRLYHYSCMSFTCRVTLVCAAISRLVDLSRKKLLLDVLTGTEQKRVGDSPNYNRFPVPNNPAASGAIVGPFMWFNPDCCSGRYRLDLSEPYQRLLARTLQG
jgi:hypothetical protein